MTNLTETLRTIAEGAIIFATFAVFYFLLTM